MDDLPYTTPDEDPFGAQPYVNGPACPRSSLLDKWIEEQQSAPSSIPAQTNPFPDISRVSPEPNDSASIISYDLVDDDDIPDKIPATPTTEKPLKLPITPTFCHFALGFRSNSPASSSSHNVDSATRALSRLTFFQRTPRSSPASSDVQQHTPSSSLSTLTASASQQSSKFLPSPASPKWRPSVLGHFHHSSVSQLSVGASETQYTPSRPSISSAETYATSRTTSIDTDTTEASPRHFLFDSLRFRHNKTLSSSSVTSKSSLLLSRPQSHDISDNGRTAPQPMDFQKYSANRVVLGPKPVVPRDIDDEDDLEPPPTYRFNKHETIRSSSNSSNSSLRRVKFASLNSRSHRKKKKLIISGVGVAEFRKLEGVRRWCESFGDIRQITRLPNGDLQVDFRDPEVADTVCRVRAKVFIAGVGSVQLSWICGNKR